MEFKQIEAFVNVVKYKSFSKAGDASFLTQPTISTHINSLEREMGVQLFDRRGRGAVLTGYGRVFYQYATAMLHTREKALLSVNDFSKDIRGILEIQASTVPAVCIVPRLIAEFQKMYPKVKYYVQQSDSREVCSSISKGEGEIGFCGSLEEPGLISEKLVEDELVVVAPVSERFQHFEDDSLEIKDIIDEPMIFRETGSGTRKEFEEHLLSIGMKQKNLNVVLRMNSLTGIIEAIKEGIGIAVLSQMAMKDFCVDRRLRVFHLKNFPNKRTFYMINSKNMTLSPVAEAFREFVLQQYNRDQNDVTEIAE